MHETSVFIGGLDRSGKTYMRFMLGSNPDFVISKRTNMWTRYFQKFGPLDRENNLNRCLDALAKNKHVLALDPDFTQIREEFQQGDCTYARLFEIIHQQYATQVQKKYWGDQTEFLERYAPFILDAYPSAKFIHLIRDPRDRYEAILIKSIKSRSLGIATARWLCSAALAKKNLNKYPERYKVILYEKMVSQPEETMIEVCDFLGVKYDPSMVKMENIARFANHEKGKKQHQSSPLSTKFIGRYKKYLQPGQVAFVQTFSSHLMKVFGYPLESRQISWKEQLSGYYSTWPSNILFLIGWRVLNFVGRGR
jgi:hypothetical protein